MKITRTIRHGIALGLCAATAACSQCAPEPAAPIEAMIPADAGTVTMTAPLGQVRAAVNGFIDKIQNQGFGQQAKQIPQALKQTLTVDLLAPDGLKQAFIDETRPAAVALHSHPGPRSRPGQVFFVPITEAAGFTKLAKQQIQARFPGAAPQTQSVALAGGKKAEITVFAAGSAATSTAVALAAYQGWALLAQGPGAGGEVARVLRTPASATVQAVKPFAALEARAGPGQIRVFMDPKNAVRWLPRAWRKMGAGAAAANAGWAVLTLDVGAGGVRLGGFVQAPKDRGAEYQRIAQAGGAPLDPAALFGGDAFLMGRFAGNPVAIIENLKRSDRQAKAVYEAKVSGVKEALGVDLEAEVLPVLSGRAGFAVYPGDMEGLAAALAQKGVNETDAAGFFGQVYVFGVGDRAKFAEVLARVEKQMLAAKLPLQIETSATAAAITRFSPEPNSGMAWALKETAFVVVSGNPLDPLIERFLRRSGDPAKALRPPGAAGSGEGQMMFLNVPEMHRMLAAMDRKKLGGKNFLINNLLSAAIDTVGMISGATFTARIQPEGMGGELHVGLK